MTKVEPAESADRDAPLPPALAAPASARAYVNVEHAGVFVIDEQGWRLAYTSREPIRDLADIDGRLHVLSSSGVQRVDKGTGSPVARLDGDSYEQLGEPVAMAGDAERLWVVGRKALGRWDGGWTMTALTEIESASSSDPEDLGVDASGRPWMILGRVLRGGEAGWSPVDLSLSFEPTPSRIATSRDQRTLLVHAGCGVDEGRTHKLCGLVRFVGDEASAHEFDATGCPDYGALALSPSGEFAAVAGPCGLLRLSLAEPGGAPRMLSVQSGWIGVMPQSMAIDDGGRVWAGVGHSLVIVDADDHLEHYPLARLTEISGEIIGLLVTGGGPTPPTLQAERRGGLRATIVRPVGGPSSDTQVPVANAKVELCSRPRLPRVGERDALTGELELDGTRSVCDGVELAATATTDGEGRFEAADLPIGGYTIAVELDGRWGQGMAKSMTMRAGMTGNIGKVVVAGL